MPLNLRVTAHNQATTPVYNYTDVATASFSVPLPASASPPAGAAAAFLAPSLSSKARAPRSLGRHAAHVTTLQDTASTPQRFSEELAPPPRRIRVL